MQKTWQRFTAALAAYSPALVARLNPGANEGTIAWAEQRLGVQFTEEVKDFFLLQNGSNGPLFGSWAFLSLEELCNDWLAMKENTPFPVQPDDDAYYSWKETWLPLLRASPSMRLYIRIDPQGDESKEDVSGPQEKDFVFQYGKLPHENLGTLFLSNSRADFVAANIDEFLENLNKSLEAGEYIYDKNIQGFRTIISTLSRLPNIHEPGFYELDADLPGADLHFGDRVAYPGLCCVSYARDYSGQFSPILQRNIAQSWKQIHSSIAQIAPGIINNAENGASMENIQQIEGQMNIHFPEELKEWYALCNGTIVSEEEVHGAFDFWSGCTLEQLYLRWKLLQEEGGDTFHSKPITGKYLTSADPRIQQIWWHPQWIPFMYHEDGSLLCIDLAPTTKGTTGQIILLIYKSMLYGAPLDIRRIPPVAWIAPDLGQFMAVFAQDLVAGKYTFDERSRMLWSREGLAYVEEDESLRFRLE